MEVQRHRRTQAQAHSLTGTLPKQHSQGRQADENTGLGTGAEGSQLPRRASCAKRSAAQAPNTRTTARTHARSNAYTRARSHQLRIP
eukprot:6184378-Pleurochrysis_carterae.AAC.1